MFCFILSTHGNAYSKYRFSHYIMCVLIGYSTHRKAFDIRTKYIYDESWNYRCKCVTTWPSNTQHTTHRGKRFNERIFNYIRTIDLDQGWWRPAGAHITAAANGDVGGINHQVMATSCYNLLSWCNNCLLHSPFLFSFRPIIVFSCSPLRCNNFAQWHFYHVTNHKSRGLQSAESVCIDKTPFPGHERQRTHNTLTLFIYIGAMRYTLWVACLCISSLNAAAERKSA